MAMFKCVNSNLGIDFSTKSFVQKYPGWGNSCSFKVEKNKEYMFLCRLGDNMTDFQSYSGFTYYPNTTNKFQTGTGVTDIYRIIKTTSETISITARIAQVTLLELF